MLKQNRRLKGFLPLGLFLLLSVIACGDPSSERPASDSAVEPVEESVEQSEGAASPENPSIETSEVLDSEALDDSEPVENATGTGLALSGDGLMIISAQSGKTESIPFDLAVETAQPIISAVLGEPVETVTNDECGAGPMSFTTWPNGFAMNALQGKFVGWTVREGTDSEIMVTMNGIGLGKTLADLESNYEGNVKVFDSTLGTEFGVAGMAGLLTSNEPEGVITSLWGGIACNFR